MASQPAQQLGGGSISSPNDEQVLAEYLALRDEINTRIGLRQQTIALTTTTAGVMLGIGASYPPAALIYPLLVTALAASWAQNDYRIRDIATRMRDWHEPLLPGLTWEEHVHSRRVGKRLGPWRLTVMAHGALFVLSQAVAVGVGIGVRTMPEMTWLDWALVALDGASILAVLGILWGAKR